MALWEVIDPAHPTPVGSPQTGHTSAVNAVAYTPDGHTLATGSYDRMVRLWNVTDSARPQSLGQALPATTMSLPRWRSAQMGAPWLAAVR